MYLLDTNACIRVLTNRSAVLVAQLRRCDRTTIHLCAVTKAELLYGAYNSARPAENLRILQSFFVPFTSLPFDDEAAGHYGRIRVELARLGKPIGANDLSIAATALAQDLTLVTANTREFGRVVGLRLENWELP